MKLTANHYKRDVSAELETALSVITTAYLRTEDIVTAVEENTAYLNPPVSRVFQDFLIQIKMVNPDVQAALRILRGRIDNEVFRLDFAPARSERVWLVTYLSLSL